MREEKKTVQENKAGKWSDSWKEEEFGRGMTQCLDTDIIWMDKIVKKMIIAVIEIWEFFFQNSR